MYKMDQQPDPNHPLKTPYYKAALDLFSQNVEDRGRPYNA